MSRRITETYSFLDLMNPFYIPPRDRRHRRVAPEDWRPGRRVFHAAPKNKPPTG